MTGKADIRKWDKKKRRIDSRNTVNSYQESRATKFTPQGSGNSELIRPQSESDLNMNTFDIINLDRMIFATEAGAGDTLVTTEYGIEAIASGTSTPYGLTYQIPTGKIHTFNVGSVGALVVSDSAVVATVDMTTANINLGAFKIKYSEISTPSPNPAANEGFMYSKDVSGVTTPMWLDSAGTETSLLGGGSGGANQSLSNLTSPTAINQDLNMGTNSISNAGAITSSSADPADTGFIRMGNGEFLAWEASPAHTTDGIITYNSSERFQFNGTIAPDVSGGQTIGASGMEWGTVYAQSLDISGPVLLNDSVLLSTIVSNLIPSGTRSLGDSTDEWEDLRIDGVAYIDTLSNIGDIIVSADLDFDTGKYPDLADTSTSVSGTGIQLPLNGSSNAACEGFVIIKVNGATKKIPYYS
jgi:hypothetical protein